MHDRVVAAIARDIDDLGFAGDASLRVLDAVGFSRVVRAKLARADDDLYVGGLVQTLGFAGSKAQNDALHRDVGVRSSDGARSRVVGAGRGGFDVRDVLAPVSKDCCGEWGERGVD